MEKAITISLPAFLRDLEVIDENGLKIIIEERNGSSDFNPDGFRLYRFQLVGGALIASCAAKARL